MALEKWSASYGFAVKGKHKYTIKKTGGFNQDFLCARGEHEKSRKAAEALERKVTSQLTGCNWKAQIRRESAYSIYTVKIVKVTHNHKPTADVRVFSVARKSFDVDVQRF